MGISEDLVDTRDRTLNTHKLRYRCRRADCGDLLGHCVRELIEPSALTPDCKLIERALAGENEL